MLIFCPREPPPFPSLLYLDETPWENTTTSTQHTGAQQPCPSSSGFLPTSQLLVCTGLFLNLTKASQLHRMLLPSIHGFQPHLESGRYSAIVSLSVFFLSFFTMTTFFVFPKTLTHSPPSPHQILG